MSTYSLAVTAYNELSPMRQRGDWLLRCIAPAQQHPRIDEIVVVDDGSDQEGLEEFLSGCPKVRAFRNPTNLGVFGNKLEAVARCTGDWVVNCDSDNLMDRAYLDRVIGMEKDPRDWISASFARPEFDYRNLVGSWTKANLNELLARPRAGCLLNTGNQTVHRESFLEVFGRYRGPRADLVFPNWLELEPSERMLHHWRLVFDALDSTVFNLTWLRSGGRLQVVESLEYDHHYSSGTDSNYIRAPREKDRLSSILFEELRQLGGQP